MVVRPLPKLFATPTLKFARLLVTATPSVLLREDLPINSPKVITAKLMVLAGLVPQTPPVGP